jgi:replicative DNA helicase
MAVNIKKEFGVSRSRKPDLTSLVYGKIPPQAPELEEAVLGAIMLEKDKMAEVLEIIQAADCFYVDAHQKIYAAIRRLFDKGSPVDLLTVTEELRKNNELEIVGGAYYLTRLTMSVVSSAHVEAHARIVMEKFIQRELIRISGEVIADAYEDSTDVFDLLDKAESGLYEITDKHLRKNFMSLSDVLVQTVQEIEEAKNKQEDVTGVPTGFR